MIVDCHSHYVPARLRRELLAGGRPHGYGVRGAETLVTPDGAELPVGYAELHEPAAKLERLDALGVDRAVISITPHLFAYEDGDALGFAQRANDDLAAFVAAGHGRLAAQGTLPLLDPAAAARELERCVVQLGFAGAIVGTSLPDGRPLDRATVDPLLEVAQAHGVPLTLHPYYAGPLRDPRWFLPNSVGVPFDTALAAATLICSGAFDRWPEATVVLVHGGGSLPFQLGRLDNAFAIKPDVAGADSVARPSSYLGRFAFDTVLHDPRALRFLADVAGEERLLLATDAPYETGQADPVGFAVAAGLDPAALGANAARLFKLGEEPRCA